VSVEVCIAALAGFLFGVIVQEISVRVGRRWPPHT